MENTVPIRVCVSDYRLLTVARAVWGCRTFSDVIHRVLEKIDTAEIESAFQRVLSERTPGQETERREA